jgi:uncharacterized protein YndB with AHSA1/START domain
MSFNSRAMPVGAAATFAALTEPETYPHWLVGADSIRDVDETWPEPGSRFHHVVGFGPLKIPDHSEVLAIEPGSMLRLKVKARPFVSAVATFEVYGDEQRCVVTLREVPSVRALSTAVRVVLDPSLHLRNQRSLDRLARHLGAGRSHAPAA